MCNISSFFMCRACQSHDKCITLQILLCVALPVLHSGVKKWVFQCLHTHTNSWERINWSSTNTRLILSIEVVYLMSALLICKHKVEHGHTWHRTFLLRLVSLNNTKFKLVIFPYCWFKYDLDWSIMYPEFDLIGMPTHDLHIMDNSFHFLETLALTTDPPVTLVNQPISLWLHLLLSDVIHFKAVWR